MPATPRLQSELRNKPTLTRDSSHDAGTLKKLAGIQTSTTQQHAEQPLESPVCDASLGALIKLLNVFPVDARWRSTRGWITIGATR
jgi:hypothetical protein